MTDNDIMPYGKYKGKKMANVPPDYLIWLYDNDKCCDEVYDYICDNLEMLKQEVELNNKSK